MKKMMIPAVVFAVICVFLAIGLITIHRHLEGFGGGVLEEIGLAAFDALKIAQVPLVGPGQAAFAARVRREAGPDAHDADRYQTLYATARGLKHGSTREGFTRAMTVAVRAMCAPLKQEGET